MSLPERYERHIHPYGRWGVWAEERRSFETRIALLEIENRELKKQLGAPARAAEWQPIETAPKDGTKILGWDGFDVISMAWAGETMGWNARELCAEEPTHWMPLPLPPCALTGRSQVEESKDDQGARNVQNG